MITLSVIKSSLGSFAFIQIVHPATRFFGFLYIIGGSAVSVTVPLSNSLCAYYTRRNLPINFGIGAGVGSLSYSFASLGIGYLIARLGSDWMIWIILCSLMLLIFLVAGYPQIDQDSTEEQTADDREPEQSISILLFWRRYTFFSVTFCCPAVGGSWYDHYKYDSGKNG